MRLGLGVAVLLAALAPAGRAEALQFAVDASTHTGVIDMAVLDAPGGQAVLGETVGGRMRVLHTVALGQLDGVARVPRAAIWRCDRTVRNFVAATATETATFSVRTPSCRERLKVGTPAKAGPGSRVRVKVTDGFRLGDLHPRVCVRPPGKAARCRPLRLRAGRRASVRGFRAAERGLWRIDVRTRWQRVRRTVAVGVPAPPAPRPRLPRILLTGDSMMANVDSVLKDRLRGRARVTSYVRVSTGLAKPGFDYASSTRRLTRKLRPAATILFLGANDGYPLRGFDCCEEPWIQAYGERAQRVIRSFGGRIVWLTLPAPRYAPSVPIFAGVNAGLARATAAEPRAQLLDLVPVFTPGFRYRAHLERGGRLVRVRETDGAHLSVAGAKIAAGLVVRALERSGALRRR